MLKWFCISCKAINDQETPRSNGSPVIIISIHEAGRAMGSIHLAVVGETPWRRLAPRFTSESTAVLALAIAFVSISKW